MKKYPGGPAEPPAQPANAAVTSWRRSRPAAERPVVRVEMSILLPQHGGHLPAPLTAGRRQARGRGGSVNPYSRRRSQPTAERLVVAVEMSKRHYSARRPPPGAAYGWPPRGSSSGWGSRHGLKSGRWSPPREPHSVDATPHIRKPSQLASERLVRVEESTWPEVGSVVASPRVSQCRRHTSHPEALTAGRREARRQGGEVTPRKEQCYE